MSGLERTLGGGAAGAASGIMSPRWRALTVGMLALTAIQAFEQLAVATVMPVVAEALDGRALYAAAFGVAMAAGLVGMVLAGRWSDRAGPAPALWSGIAAFGLGVCGAGLALDMRWLVLARALQGFGTGLVAVALYVVVGRSYPQSAHPRIFAAFAAAWVVPVIVGPALAAGIVLQFGWRWVFLAAAVLALPVALLLRTGLAQLSARDGADPAAAPAPRPRGLLATALATALCAGVLYAAGPLQGADALWALPALIGVCALAPRLLPAGTFSGRPGLPAVIALRGLAAAAFFSGEVLIPLLLVSERGLSPLQAGLVLTAGALGWCAASWVQGRQAADDGGQARARVLRWGMAAIGAGVLAVAAVLLPAVPVAVAGLAWTVVGVGIGSVYPILSVLTLECAPAGGQGAASSALQLSDALFSAVGLAVASALLSALLPAWPRGAYLAAFAAVSALGWAGVRLASRAHPAPR